MCFVDKNPESDCGENEPLSDDAEWEHRVIMNVVWWKRMGYAVETALYGTPDEQSIERYQINSQLHEMIRDSPHNKHPMDSEFESE